MADFKKEDKSHFYTDLPIFQGLDIKLEASRLIAYYDVMLAQDFQYTALIEVPFKCQHIKYVYNIEHHRLNGCSRFKDCVCQRKVVQEYLNELQALYVMFPQNSFSATWQSSRR